MEGNSTDLLAGKASREAKRTKRKLTRQKAEWTLESRWEEMLAKNQKTTEGQEKTHKVNLGRNLGITSGKLELR